MDPMERLLAERACERLVIDFVHRLDLGEPSSVAELFTEDGVWQWPEDGRLVKGRDALRAYFGSRPADRLFHRADGTWLLASRTLHLPFGGATPRTNSPLP
ncbi:nuclear transport factor 2 family protein [Streptomyces sp. NPDC000070]|uniref:nuclear transport factor 2 family protein n=1 Tax=Streptomyces sp. NPDC000070 TaxID=3154240 RepID=UPI00331B8FDB